MNNETDHLAEFVGFMRAAHTITDGFRTPEQRRCADCACLVEACAEWWCDEFGCEISEVEDCPEQMAASPERDFDDCAWEDYKIARHSKEEEE